MRLAVCPLDAVRAEVRRLKPDGVISLLAPEQPVRPLPGDPPRLLLQLHDIAAPQRGLVAPGAEAVEALLAFAAGFADDAALLVHCWMGISRSPAAAFVIACARAPDRPEVEIARALRQAAPTATPNPALVRLADGQLGRAGRMVAAIEAIGRGAEAACGAPFVLDA